jgi:hypothetical protein
MPLNSEFKKKLLKKSKIKYAEARKSGNIKIQKKESGNKKSKTKKVYVLAKILT